MRAFASIILHLLAPTTFSILLLDEPEAFLHPPQARLLGEIIARERPPHTQLFVATHSTDVLQGLLNAASQHLRIVRIQRDNVVNRIKELPKDKVGHISRDPLLRYSGVFHGLFHERVIICESDADCMFYNAILDLPIVHGDRHPDVIFIHGNGKNRIAQLAETLTSLGVRVDVVVDLALIGDMITLRRIIEVLGGNWIDIELYAKSIKSDVESSKCAIDSSNVVKQVRGALEDAPTSGEFPDRLRKGIIATLRTTSPWNYVPVGELEGFCKIESGHGPQWVQTVLEKYDLALSRELQDVRDFIKEIWTKS